MSDIPDDVPEADALDQRWEVDEDAPVEAAGPGEFPTEASEGDLVEQTQEVNSGGKDRREEDGS